MDFSIKNISNKKINFKGVKGDFNSKNEQIFRFNLPSYNPLKEIPQLEITFLRKEYSPAGVVVSNNYSSFGTYRVPFNDSENLELLQESFKKNKFDGFSYRYVFTNKETNEERYALDASKKITLKGKEQNLIEIGQNYGVTPYSGPMRHSFIDSDGIDIENLSEKDKNFVRNHFNKLQGSLKGLNYLLKKGYFDSFKYIISTPDIGADPTSSHKYWPNNQYQCSSLEDFKDFNFELFKRGKGYIADGAFTSQSLQSPLVHHVLKWGKKSPFYYMLKMGEGLNLGILPENSNAFEHIGVKLVNSPKNKNYDKNKPTYMQFFDDRLSSPAQRNDTQHLIESYDIHTPQDHFDITTYQDSIYPFYFEITDNEMDKKLKLFKKDANTLMLKDLDSDGIYQILKVQEGGIVNRYAASNATFWDGNVDIIKMNLSNPDSWDSKNVEGFKQAREYLLNVATYWSETIQSNLILESAKLSDKELEKVALNNSITKDDFEEIKRNINSPDTVFPTLEQNKTIKDYIEEFPLQSIETAPELSAIFSEPQFKEEFLTESNIRKISAIVEKAIDKIASEKYSKDSEKFEPYKTYLTKTTAKEILRYIYIYALKPDLIALDGSIDLNKLKNEVTLKLLLTSAPYSVEDERRQVINKISRGIDSSSIEKVVKKLSKELKDVSLEDFKLAESVVIQGHGGLNWRFDAAKDIADLNSRINGTADFSKLWNGSESSPGVEEFWADFIKRVKTYNPSSYIITEITNFGDFYNWDDLESMMNYDEKAANSYLAKIKNDIIKKDGSDSYLAKLADIFANPNEKTQIRKEAFEKAKPLMEQNGKANYPSFFDYENNLPYSKEQQFLEQIGASTSSNYDKYFNNLSAFLGVDPEHGSDKGWACGNLWKLKEQTQHLMKYSQPNGILMSHVFVDNHDKPRINHTLPLNMELYIISIKNEDTIENYLERNPEIKKQVMELTSRNDFENMNSSGLAVGLMFKEKIEEIYSKDEDKKQRLLNSLKDLVNGTKDGKYNPLRSRAFATLPYEVTIKDLFKGAGIEDEKEINEFNYKLMENSLDLQNKLWQTMNALVGVPTLYYGTEYGQTGYETASKNVYVGNRNRALHERRNIKGFSDFYDKMSAISSLSLEPSLSALKNGFPEMLEITTKNNLDFFPIYKKDEFNSEVLSVITNYGLEKNQQSRFHKIQKSPSFVQSIELKDENAHCPFNDGQVLNRMVYDKNQKKYIKENVKYIIQDGKVERADKKPILIDDSVLTFFVDKKKTNKFVSVYNTAH